MTENKHVLSTSELGYISDKLMKLIMEDLGKDELCIYDLNYLEVRTGITREAIFDMLFRGRALSPDAYVAIAASLGTTVEQLLRKEDEVDESEGTDTAPARTEILREAIAQVDTAGDLLEDITEAWRKYLEIPLETQDVAALLIIRTVMRIGHGQGTRDDYISIAELATLAYEASEDKECSTDMT